MAIDSSTTGTPAKAKQGADWRLGFSMVLTVGWLLLGVAYVSQIIGWRDFASQNAPSLGSFLEGAFAPLAFLWLVVGFFLQQRQLQDNTKTIQLQLEQMRRSAEQAEIQSRAIAADELHSRQDTFLRSRLLVADQLAMISGWILSSHTEDVSTLMDQWARTGQGEPNAFPLEIIRRVLSNQIDAHELFYGTAIRAGHTERYCIAFDRLIDAGTRCDPTGMICDALREGAQGRIYRMMVERKFAT